MRSYPSITLLVNTRPGSSFGDGDEARAHRLAETAGERLATLIDDDPGPLVDALHRLIDERVGQRSSHALAVCVSTEHDATVVLGGAVDERVVIDETFTTRDLVADLNRTAAYRVLAVSNAVARSFVGDRRRLVEERSSDWPLRREEATSDTVWSQTVTTATKRLDSDHSMPVVTAGVGRSVRNLLDASGLDVIGHVPGNHDRTGAAELHTLAWPIVLDWRALRQLHALDDLDAARSSRHFAAGVDELWTLAEEGRVEHLVVEDRFAVSARVGPDGHLHPTDDDHRDVTDDVVDELIESVLRNGGRTTIVDDSTLEAHGRIAAVLRY